MDIRGLRYFVAIVDCGSLTKAAEQVRVAQPALSQQLAALEAELEVPLLLRSSKGVAPTDAGSALYRHARAILKQLEATRDEVRTAGAMVSGTVAIGLPTTVAALVAMPLLRAVRARHPDVRLQLFESMSGYIGELLANWRLDFAILFRDADSRIVELEPLAQETLYLIGQCGASLAPDGQDSVALQALGSLPLALPSGAQGLRLLIERSFAQAGIALDVVAELDSLPCLLGAAQEGLACTILPVSVLAATGMQTPCWRITPEIRRTLSLCWPRSGPRTPAAQAVEAILREIVAERLGEDGTLG
ncbi:LysR substrate-binding domain-containing protein [Bordetella bronchiseptica]|uniref:LysR substrate-binding domain-containing protein n=1 Tax=Bordetella bronchiseptica TaxID=518 RepID=UPI003EDC4160